MRTGIEVPVGGVITICGLKLVCVEDYYDKHGAEVGCSVCPIKDMYPCEHLDCGFAIRTDGKSVHFEKII